MVMCSDAVVICAADELMFAADVDMCAADVVECSQHILSGITFSMISQYREIFLGIYL